MKSSIVSVDKLRDVENINLNLEGESEISKAYISKLDTEESLVTITLEANDELFDAVLKEVAGGSINTKGDLLKLFIDFNEGRSEYENIKGALKQVYQTGYGIVYPTLKDMELSTPEIIKQGSRYGVKLKANACSYHIIKADVISTFEPIIGSELQSKELINSLTKDGNSDNIWKSEIFGRSLDVIVQEGIQAKLSMMPDNIRNKLGTTLTKVINKGSNTMIAIVL